MFTDLVDGAVVVTIFLGFKFKIRLTPFVLSKNAILDWQLNVVDGCFWWRWWDCLNDEDRFNVLLFIEIKLVPFKLLFIEIELDSFKLLFAWFRLFDWGAVNFWLISNKLIVSSNWRTVIFFFSLKKKIN